MIDNPQYKDRMARLEKWRLAGIDPYGRRVDGLISTEQARALHSPNLEDTPHDGGPQARVAGRITLLRDIGKLIFMTIADSSGRLQIGVAKQILGEKFTTAKLLELGDIAWFSGKIGHTKTGEITLWADDFGLATKALLPPPEKFHGLSDTETRYRQRYLDLMANPQSMEIFLARSQIVRDMRDFLHARNFMEVETPMMQSLAGGAAARPFTTHHHALDTDLYLRISPELFLKRLLVGGIERVFEINRNFRNEGIDTRHNPEFTMLELYEAYSDLAGMMELTQTLVAQLAKKRAETLHAKQPPPTPGASGLPQIHLPYGERVIDFTPPFIKKTYAELLWQSAQVDLLDPASIKAGAARHGLENARQADTDVLAGELFERLAEPALAALDQPVFVVDYPAGLCPLTRRNPQQPQLAERFELYVAGMELANAYTELNDPLVQEATFGNQLAGLKEEDSMARMDQDFVEALRYGMPPAGGLGIGIDRLVMLLTNCTSIRDVVLFPQLKPRS